MNSYEALERMREARACEDPRAMLDELIEDYEIALTITQPLLQRWRQWATQLEDDDELDALKNDTDQTLYATCDQTWTVIGFFSDNCQVFCEHVEDCADAATATIEAINTILGRNGWSQHEAGSIEIVEVFPGKHKGYYSNEGIVRADKALEAAEDEEADADDQQEIEP